MLLIQTGVPPNPWWCGRWECTTCDPPTIFDMEPTDRGDVFDETTGSGQRATRACPVCGHPVVIYQQVTVLAEAAPAPTPPKTLPARPGQRVRLTQQS